MTYHPDAHSDARNPIDQMPSWVTGTRSKAFEDAVFQSGAALSHLNLVSGQGDVPQVLWRDCLALQAAEACVAQSGRPERAGELRDALAFLQPGDHPGPAGEVYLTLRRAVERPVSVKALNRALPGLDPRAIAAWLDAGQGAPVARAASVLEIVLADAPGVDVSGADVTALILADAALAQALGWAHVLPVLSAGMKQRDLRKTGEDLRFACHRAVVASAVEAVRGAADLTRRAARLRMVAPKLRARGAGQAVELFLTRDAVAPSALVSLNSDRAARRFCDRLVELGVVRELTGRDTFRLYGV